MSSMRTASLVLSLSVLVAIVWIGVVGSPDGDGRSPGPDTAKQRPDMNQRAASGRAGFADGAGAPAKNARDANAGDVVTGPDGRSHTDGRSTDDPSGGSVLSGEGKTVAPQVSSVDRQDLDSDPNAGSRPRSARRSDLDLRGKDLAGGNFRGGDLTSADLRGANLKDADFSDANLSGANLEDAVFDSTNLRRAKLRDVSLLGVEIDGINMASADFSGADLRGARLSCDECGLRSDARGATFAGADMRGLEFGRTVVHKAILDGADLRGANMALAHGTPMSMRGALYDMSTRLPPSVRPELRLMEFVDADATNDGSAGR